MASDEHIYALSSSGTTLYGFKVDSSGTGLSASMEASPAANMRDIALAGSSLFASQFEQEEFKLLNIDLDGNVINGLLIQALGDGLSFDDTQSLTYNSGNVFWGMQGIVAAAASIHLQAMARLYLKTGHILQDTNLSVSSLACQVPQRLCFCVLNNRVCSGRLNIRHPTGAPTEAPTTQLPTNSPTDTPTEAPTATSIYRLILLRTPTDTPQRGNKRA